MRFLERRRARRALVAAALSVYYTWEPGLVHEFDPDDLTDFIRAAREYEEMERK